MLTLPGRAGESVRLIPFDLPRTLPELAFFQPGGPRHEECVRRRRARIQRSGDFV